MDDQLLKLFMKQAREEGDCLLWVGPGFGEHGYGLFKEMKLLAHRAAFEHDQGRKAVGLVKQSCGNKRCVKGAHLSEVPYGLK